MEQGKMIRKIGQRALIVKGNEILSIKRSLTDKSSPGRWELPGGTVDDGEDLLESLLREVDEETQLKISDVKPLTNLSFSYNSKFYVIMIYSAKFLSGNVVLSYEHDDFKWVNKDNYTELNWSPWQKPIIDNHFKSDNI